MIRGAQALKTPPRPLYCAIADYQRQQQLEKCHLVVVTEYVILAREKKTKLILRLIGFADNVAISGCGSSSLYWPG